MPSSIKRFLCRILVVTVLVCVLPFVSNGTVSAAQTDPQFGQHRNQSADEAQREREQARARNKERQEKLKADTDKLLQLATELKQYVDKTNENILSIEVIKKTEEIEKLAKSVREKMKTYEQPPGEGFPPR